MSGIRIDELDATVLPNRDHVVPAMKDGLTVKLTVGQILDLLGKVLDPDEVGSKALFAALNLSDLDDPEQARENLGATEIGHALFTAQDKAAGRSAIDALGPDETPDKAFRRGNILGAVSQSGGTPTGAIIERGSNANGEYIRFADGTQICWHTLASQTDSAATWTYPVSFLPGSNVMAVCTGSISPSNEPRIFGYSSIIATSANFRAITYSGSPSGITASHVAIGRWF